MIFNKKRIFCLSYQRTGTTSTGQFLNDHGYRCAGWGVSAKQNWTNKCYEGDFESIFRSRAFNKYNAFEDAPWFYPDFFKVLYHRFPGAKFILLTRDADKWFDSMLLHSGGDILGHNQIHTKVYRRELEYFERLAKGEFKDQSEPPMAKEKNKYPMELKEEHREWYKGLYALHLAEVENFFKRHNSAALHVGRLEDTDKWQKLAQFLGVKANAEYSAHQNKASEWKV